MMQTNVNGVWKRVRALPIKPDTTVVPAKVGYVKVNGAWQIFFQAFKSLLLQGTCNGDPAANNFRYELISTQQVVVAAGDKLIYEMKTLGPNAITGLDAGLLLNGVAKGAMRDFTNPTSGAIVKDQNGIAAHPAGSSYNTTNTWYYRELNLDPLAGYTLNQFAAVLEGDAQGTYQMYLRDVRVVDSAGNLKLSIFSDTIQYTTVEAFQGTANGYVNVSKTVVDSPL